MRENNEHIDFDLISKYLSGEASLEEIDAIDEWRESKAENQLEFDRMVVIWEEAQPWSKKDLAAVNTDAAWLSLHNRIRSQDSEPGTTAEPSENVRSLFYYVARIAAVLIIGFVVYGIYKLQFDEPDQKELIAANTVIETKLSDETRITLNENSKITYPEKFREKTREVALNGEAFFEVKSEEEKPFIIHVEKAQIQVMGTSFNVRAMQEERDISVTVQEGKVRLADEEDIAFVVLGPNEKGILDKETGNIEKYSKMDGSEMFWKTKTLIFRDTRLETVFETLERVYEIDIDVSENKIFNCELTAKFQDVSIEEILDNIALNFNLTIIKEDQTFKIEGDGC